MKGRVKVFLQSHTGMAYTVADHLQWSNTGQQEGLLPSGLKEVRVHPITSNGRRDSKRWQCTCSTMCTCMTICFHFLFVIY